MNTPRRWAVPKGLLGAVVLVACVEAVSSRATSRWPHELVLDWRETPESVGAEAPGCGLLCFGSSMVKLGVLPSVIQARTGLRGYNLALLNGPAPASYFLLRRAVDRGARPGTVVVDFDQARLGADPRSGQLNYPWAELLRPGEAFDLARRTGDPSLASRLLAQEALPTLRRRHDVRMAVLARVNGFRGPLDEVGTAFGAPKLAFARNRRVNRGAVVNPTAVSGQNSQTRFDGQDPVNWRVHPANAAYVAAFCGLCRSLRIEVVWLIPPVALSQQGMADKRRSEDRYVRAVRELAGRFPNVTVVDGRHAGYPNEVFVDHTHLDRVGAAELSAALASILPRSAGDRGSRWVDLPRYTGARFDAGLEDLVQSAEAIKSASATAR